MTSDDPSGAERVLAVRVVDTLLRENYADLTERVHVHQGSPVLRLPVDADGRYLELPLERDGFLADLRVRRTGPEIPLTLEDVRLALSTISDPADRDGVAAFVAECRQALAAIRLRDRHPLDPRAGQTGQLIYEALAAHVPHPVYPTSESRLGFDEEDLLRYAPEYLPEFELHWVAIPRDRLTTAGQPDRPPGWPAAADVGLPESLASTHELLPVHPLTARGALVTALEEAGLAAQAALAPGTALRVSPTLSTRTMIVAGQPRIHIKVPLPTSTLGLLNRRHFPPGTLEDGALMYRVLSGIGRTDTTLSGLLLADDGTYAHADHRYLGYLLRRIPAGLEQSRIVPVAALLAPSLGAVASGGRPLVIEELADWAWGGDVPALFDAYLRSLFDVHVRLFTRYGIAMESHQQNTALVIRPGDSAPRLLLKDFDGTLIQGERLASALGPDAPAESAFADPRLLTKSDDALADVFITITVHLCAGALAFGLADRGVAPLPQLLGMVRNRLADALRRHADWPAANVLRARVLDADRLPGKSMVTAGTLVAKSRTGASDINKFYGTNGPNYLQ